MAIADFHINLNIWLRWLHVLAGILWLGQLYVLDLVFLRLMRSLVDSQCDSTLRNIMLRGSEWLRWSSMTSALSGIFLFVSNYFYVPGVGFAPNLLLIEDRQLTERSLWILFGMALALVMWFNVWFVICPARRELLLRAEFDSIRAVRSQRRHGLAIRTNTILSGPMLFAMLAPSHYGSINLSTWGFVIAISTLTMLCLSRSASINPRPK